MARYLKYTFPATNTQDICLTQSTAGAGFLTIDGYLANKINGEVDFSKDHYCRNVSITSDNDLSGVIFTVLGTQNGVVISEDIVGPNNDTVVSTELFDVINSVSVDDAVADVSVGTGCTGFFLIVGIDLQKTFLSYQAAIANTVGLDITIFGTALSPKDFSNTQATYLDMIDIDDRDKYFVYQLTNDPQNIAFHYSNIIPMGGLIVYLNGTGFTFPILTDPTGLIFSQAG